VSILFPDRQRPFHPPAPDPLVVDGLRRVVAAVQPEVVHAHSWMLYSFLPIKEHCGARLMVTLHDYGLFCPTKTLLYEGEVCSGPGAVKCVCCSAAFYGGPKALAIASGLAISHHRHRHVDQFLAISSFVARASAPHMGGCQGTIPVVPSFIADESAHYTPSARPDLALPGGPFILFVGALARHKGLGVLLEAYGALAPALPLVLMGPLWVDTPARFPSNVTVITDAPHDLVMEAWARCRLGVVPSLWPEPLGLVALEALAMGRPLIASRVGGLTDIVRHGETGLLVTPGDVDGLHGAMHTLLHDDALGTRLGRMGRQQVLSRFTASVVVPQIEEFYARVLSKRAPAPIS
jgi:glycosyltransferase involved in cell wall biosynthesis